MLLFEEQMNLRVIVSNLETSLSVHSRDEVLPRILSQHADARETGSDVAKDGVSFAPFVI